MVLAQPQAAQDLEVRLIRFPAVHGDNVVFTYASDLWLGSLKGGHARRLTTSNGQETRARISPDGKWIAFTGTYDGNADAFVVPIDGGEPKRLTFEPDPDSVLGWTPDGKIMVSSTYGNYTNRMDRLWLVDPNGGLPQRTVVEEIAEGSMMADGKTLVYHRADSAGFNWRRYRGGTQGKISFFNLETNAYSELPAGREQNYYPMAVGRNVYFISDRNAGTLNLYRHNLDNKRTVQLTNYTDGDIKWPSTDGKTIVFERDGYLMAYDIASDKVTQVNPIIRSDNVAARPIFRRLGDQISGMSLSPSGARVVVEARGEIFSVPARTGDTRNMSNSSGSRERFPSWSPDGRTIAYVSDESGDFEIYTQPQMGGTPVQLTTAKKAINGLVWSPDSKKIAFRTRNNELFVVDVATKAVTQVVRPRFGLSSFDWSPDSKWIAYIDQMPNSFGAVFVYDVEAKKATQVTAGRYDDDQVEFDMNGKYLYLTSVRTFAPTFGTFEFSLKVEDAQRVYAIPLQKGQTNPLSAPSDEEPETPAAAPAGSGRPAGAPASAPAAPAAPSVKIDFDGIQDRLIVLPMPAGSYRLIAGLNNGLLYATSGGLFQFSFTNRQPVQLAQGVGGQIALNANRTKMAYYFGGVLGIVDIRPGIELGQGRVDTNAVEALINPRDEWQQMYWEAWRWQRDNFYDPGMLGLNWRAIGDKYAKFLPYVSHRSDLNYVLGLMIGELGTGHAYVSGGDMGPMPTPVPTGQLGVDYEVANGAIRIAKIYRGSNYDESRRGPLGDPGVEVNEGEYLLAIDGKPVGTGNPNALLVGKANRFVTLTVNSKPSMDGARRVRVRTIGGEGNLRYAEWVEANRRYVERVSNGRIGYMHVPDTATQGAIEFIRGFYSNTDKDAVVVDERFNGGGFIQPWFVDTLARRIRAGIANRSSEMSTDAVAIEGPKVMLINGYAGSGGDFFPWMFRQQKLGPLVGTRTWGGLVGISGGAPLVDGGNVTAPEFGIFDRENGKWIAENTGVDPDIEVDARPDLRAKGQDPQLERGVQILMEQLRKQPRRPVRQPDFPRVTPSRG